MDIPYKKPHLTYDQQIDKLVGRGLAVANRAATISALKLIGYYRLSAYLHTFRPVKEDGASGHDERLNSYYPGSTYEQVVELWAFDRALRLVLLDGLEKFELPCERRLPTTQACSMLSCTTSQTYSRKSSRSKPATTDPKRLSSYDEWLVKYLERVDNSKNEAFVE